jgi:pimeloyl-ACP methyl ester carboxylesterase
MVPMGEPRSRSRRAELAREAEAPRRVRIHGHEVSYRAAGEGPVLLLVHGMAGSCRTWRHVMAELAEDHTVIAPDLLGHGQSDKPRGDYSLGAHACGVRDLLTVLGHERATLVGHSLGGGIAMQFAYQFPTRCERLVLVGSGGLGRDVSPLLRVLSAPGTEYLLTPLLDPRLHALAGRVGSRLGRLGFRADPALEGIWNGWTDLTDARALRAFLHTVRAVIDPAGQRVSARDRLYLAAHVPTLIVWGERDRIIPVSHAHAAHDLIPGSRLEVIEGAGHFLPLEQPARLVEIIEDFLATTEPSTVHEGVLTA